MFSNALAEDAFRYELTRHPHAFAGLLKLTPRQVSL